MLLIILVLTVVFICLNTRDVFKNYAIQEVNELWDKEVVHPGAMDQKQIVVSTKNGNISENISPKIILFLSTNAAAARDPMIICAWVVQHPQVVARTAIALTLWTSMWTVVWRRSKKHLPMNPLHHKSPNGFYWVLMWVFFSGHSSRLSPNIIDSIHSFLLQAVVLLMSIMLAIHYTNQRRRYNY